MYTMLIWWIWIVLLSPVCHGHDSKVTEVETEEALLKEFDRDTEVRKLIQEAKEVGEKYLKHDFELKFEFLRNGTDMLNTPMSGSASCMLSYHLHTPTEAETLDNKTTISTVAYMHLLTRINDNSDFQENVDVDQDDFLEEWEDIFCPNPISVVCDKRSRFREITGHCNNLENPFWGNSFAAHIRLIDPVYQDTFGLFGPRSIGKSKKPLPSPREVSLKLLQTGPEIATPDDNEFTVAVPAFGQFVDHDCTETPLSTGFFGAEIGCGKGSSRFQCFDIGIPGNDPTFAEPYMRFTRSVGGLADYCVPGPRQQLNSLTSFLDSSNVYGSEDERAETLWDHTTGLLSEGFPGLPPIDTEDSCVLHGDDDETTYCFRTGDIRGNELNQLTIMHTLFVRLHNRIAAEFRIMNKMWNPKRVFEETRRIVSAVFQHLIYNHWLKIIIGDDLMEEYGLTNSSSYQYNSAVNPGTTSAFISAAFRFGHTLVQSMEGLVNSDHEILSEELLEELFFNPRLVFQNATQAARFVTTKVMKTSDRFVTGQLTNHLFQEGNTSLDLISLNIQRGRDHGLPGYLAYRRYFGIDNDVITSFDDLPSHTPEAIEIMKGIYDDVEDIDLFAGGLSETVLKCGQVGETFARIIAEQFHRFKYGDRFFYLNKKLGRKGRNSFTTAQIQSIESVTFSRLLCVEYNMSHIQPNIFKKIHAISNKLQRCEDFKEQQLDLALWRVRKG